MRNMTLLTGALIFITACRTVYDPSELQDNAKAKGKNACELATAKVPSSAQVAATFKCTEYKNYADKTNRSDFYALKVVQPLNACVVIYTDANQMKQGIFVDVSNAISHEAMLPSNPSNEDVSSYFIGRDAVSSIDVFGWRNPYHFYRLLEYKDGRCELDVDRQVIGLGRRNEYVYTANCQKLK